VCSEATQVFDIFRGFILSKPRLSDSGSTSVIGSEDRDYSYPINLT
jgi:hypothetical protein